MNDAQIATEARRRVRGLPSHDHTAFEDHEKMLYKFAWRFAREYNLEVGDLISEAYLVYLTARRRFDPSRGVRFGTFLWRSMERLRDYCEKEKTQQIRISGTFDEVEDAVLTDGLEALTEIEIIKDAVSEEARMLLEGIQEGIFDVINPIRQHEPGISRVREISRQTWGWGQDKTDRVVTEIRHFALAGVSL